MIRPGFKLILLLLAVLSGAILWQKHTWGLDALVHVDPLPATRELVAAGQYAEAADYLGYFMEFGYVSGNPEAQALNQHIADTRNSWQYQASKLGEGLIKGTSDEDYGQMAGVITDFFVIGDLRDLAVQGVNLARGEEVDQVLVALAALGVVASAAELASGAATVSTAGAAAPAAATTTTTKAGLVTLKTARKMGALPPWLGKTLVQSVQSIKTTRSFASLSRVMGDVTTLAKTRGGFKLLGKTRNSEELARMAHFANTFESRSAALYRLGGDTMVDIAQREAIHGKRAILQASTYGTAGLHLLERMGASRFLTMLDFRFSLEALQMLWRGKVVDLLLSLALKLPNWILVIGLGLGMLAWLPWGLLLRRQAAAKQAVAAGS